MRAGMGQGASGFTAQRGTQEKPPRASDVQKAELGDLHCLCFLPMPLLIEMQENGAVIS